MSCEGPEAVLSIPSATPQPSQSPTLLNLPLSCSHSALVTPLELLVVGVLRPFEALGLPVLTPQLAACLIYTCKVLVGKNRMISWSSSSLPIFCIRSRHDLQRPAAVGQTFSNVNQCNSWDEESALRRASFRPFPTGQTTGIESMICSARKRLPVSSIVLVRKVDKLMEWYNLVLSQPGCACWGSSCEKV